MTKLVRQSYDNIVSMANDILMGKIGIDVIERQDKGLNYDKDVQEAADTGFVEGKNQRIDMKKKKRYTASARLKQHYGCRSIKTGTAIQV